MFEVIGQIVFWGIIIFIADLVCALALANYLIYGFKGMFKIKRSEDD